MKPAQQVEQRIAVINRARRWAVILTLCAVLVLLWALIWPKPHTLVIWALIGIPVIAVISLRFFPGALVFDPRQDSAHANITGGFLLPTLGLCFRALQDWHILNWAPFWVGFGIITFLTAGALFHEAGNLRVKTVSMVFALLVSLLYGFGLTIALNSITDTSEPVVYSTHIIEKNEAVSKTSLSTFTLAPWGNRAMNQVVGVKQSLFEQKVVGEAVEVTLKRGGLGIPWFSLR
jgi:hypothetical protein